MTNEDYVERIKKRVSKIMFENKTLFPIVEDIFFAAEHYKIPEKDLEFYVRETISSRIGLGFIVRNKLKGADEIRWTIGNDFIEKVEIASIKSILSEYLRAFPSKEEREKFNSIEI